MVYRASLNKGDLIAKLYDAGYRKVNDEYIKVNRLSPGLILPHATIYGDQAKFNEDICEVYNDGRIIAIVRTV